MRFIKMQSKDVVDVSTGSKIGYVSDLEIDERCRCIEAIIVERYSLIKLICFFKGPPVLIIPIENIITIGDDVILVRNVQ
ncbi:MAG: YlmC/YmxH family sporulation protein [Erysipelotrichaceae bacterium]|nr:YlmC/YmxH family sporulation protein [Erysipelotrichaceae bacterium]